ncbi:MAG: Hsp20/alpha crystallin family protein [Planctomycetes bacterium]|nr:Hsp20/alpha crystallin family protein [Planctomycetota bacterium]
MSRLPLSLPRTLSNLQDELGHMLNRMWHTGISTRPLDGQSWAPIVDVLEESNGYVLTAEVPGLRVEDIDVAYEDGDLVIRGQKTSTEDEEDTGEYIKAERRFGAFCRRITLPEPVNSAAITATCRMGLLTVHLPRKEPIQRQTVTIQVLDD